MFKVGDKVFRKGNGIGTVIAIEGMLEQYPIVVQFDSPRLVSSFSITGKYLLDSPHLAELELHSNFKQKAYSIGLNSLIEDIDLCLIEQTFNSYKNDKISIEEFFSEIDRLNKERTILVKELSLLEE